jgi:hypothetical protein
MNRGVILLYRSTCPKCRALSLAIVLLSVGWVRRLPLASVDAIKVYDAHSMRPGKLTVVGYGRAFSGWRVVPGFGVLAAKAIQQTFSRVQDLH